MKVEVSWTRDVQGRGDWQGVIRYERGVFTVDVNDDYYSGAVRLTRSEADALYHALGSDLGHPDCFAKER